MSKIDLLKHTIEVTRIDCSKCNRVETIQDAAEQAIDELHKLGWRIKKDKCICPSCGGFGDGRIKVTSGKFPNAEGSDLIQNKIVLKSFVKDLRK